MNFHLQKKNFRFLPNFYIFLFHKVQDHYLNKFFVKNRKFRQKSKFWSNIEILVKKKFVNEFSFTKKKLSIFDQFFIFFIS